MKINLERIKNDLNSLASITSTPGKGVTRSAWSEEDHIAKDYLKKEMIKAGLYVYEDTVGTLFGRREGSNTSLPVVMVGSHYDSVVNGGAYDGTLGTIAALETMRVLNEVNFNNEYPIVMIAMNAEEGETFGPSTGVTNSRAMVGTLTYEELDTVKNRFGLTKRQAMESYGLNIDLEKSIWKKGSIKHFIELHIEQGLVLEEKSKDIGFVEYLPGIGRYKITFTGKNGDSTMPLKERKDALLAASIYTVKVNEFLSQLGEGITGGVSEMNVFPNSNQFVPSKVEAKIEIRTFMNYAQKEVNITKELEGLLIEVEKETRVNTELIEMRRIGYDNPTSPSIMDKRVINTMKKICDKNHYSYMILNNGTGHDSMIMSEFTRTNLIYIPCVNGISHHPDEYSHIENVGKGIQLVLELTAQVSKL